MVHAKGLAHGRLFGIPILEFWQPLSRPHTFGMPECILKLEPVLIIIRKQMCWVFFLPLLDSGSDGILILSQISSKIYHRNMKPKMCFL